MEAEWWTGKIGEDRVGVFPFNYVKLSVSEATVVAAPAAAVAENDVAAVQAGQDGQAAAPDAAAEENRLKTSSMKRSKKKKKDGDGEKKKPVIAKVVASYEATSKEQLSLSAGQMILVRKKTETGWWQGEIQGVRRQILKEMLNVTWICFVSLYRARERRRSWAGSRPRLCS